jgi:kynurenine formamidase
MIIRAVTLLRAAAISSLTFTGLPTGFVDHEAAWAQTPVSPYGQDDRLGAANLLSPEHVRKAAATIKRGKVYALGAIVDENSPLGETRPFKVVVVQPGAGAAHGMAANRLSVLDDVVIASQGVGTKLNGLAHVGIDGVFYNGLRAEDFIWHSGLKALGVESIPPIVGRGVLLDIAAYRNVTTLPRDFAIDAATLQAAAHRQKLTMMRGDIVLLNTGWMDARPKSRSRAMDAPGLTLDGARWLIEQGIVAVGADTDAVEIWPAQVDGEISPVHQELMTRHGVYMIHNVVTRELAADRAYSFLFVLGQPRLKGATQAIVNPIAIR